MTPESRHMRRLVLSMVILFLAPGFCPGQDRDIVNSQIWVDITLFNEYNQKIELYGDGGYRRIFATDVSWDRLYVRPSFKYSPWPWLGLRAGVGLFYTHYAPKTIESTLEVRPWQGLSIGWPNLSRIRFSHYLRLEQRVINNAETWEDSYDLRFRYQLSARIQPNIEKKVKYFYLPIFAEVFSSKEYKSEVPDLFGHELRLGFGLGYTWNIRWSGQFVLIFQQSRNELNGFSTSDLLFRFSVKTELVPAKDMKRIED